MDAREVLHAFWRQASPPGNNPAGYIYPVGRSEALLELIADVPADARILEVGCNVGRNLAHLHDRGWRHTEGVEISPHAVALLRATYPQLAGVPVHVGAAEDVLPTLPDDGFDLVVTMAVLQHIHPDSSAVFDHIVRIGRQVLAVEPPGRASHRSYPHDVEALFTARGMALTSRRRMAEVPGTAGDPAISRYEAWRFRR